MEKMWSPWRSVYIESFNLAKKEECIFCNSVLENFEHDNSLVVYIGKSCFVVLNLYPYNNGHLMIVPNRHLNDFSLLSMEEKSEILELTDLSMKALKSEINPQGFNFGANIGKAAGAGIDDHLHFHIVPRWSGDTNFMPVLGEVKIISQELLETRNRLRKVFIELVEKSSNGK